MNQIPYHHIHNIINGRPNHFSDTIDWPAFLDRVFQEQLQGMAYQNLKQSEVPERVIHKLEQAYYASFAANTYRLKAIEELEPQLANKNIRVMVIKGTALLESVYPDPGTRPMEDIDLMINPEDFSKLKSALIQSGYIEDSIFHHMFRKHGILIDVHTSLLHTGRIESRKTIFPVDMNRIFNVSLPWQPGFKYIRRLDDATHIIYLAHHMIKHSFSKLIWLIDVHRIFESQDQAFWDRLGRNVIKYKQERPMAYMLYVLDKIFGTRPPVSSVFLDYQKNLTYFEKVILRIKGRGGSIDDLGNLLWMFCLSGTKEKLRFTWETMFPKKEVLQRELSCASGHTGRSLYVHRSVQLTRRLLQNLKIIAKEILHLNSLPK